MARPATIKACWSGLGGAGGVARTYPGDVVPLDGLSPLADRSSRPREPAPMYRFDLNQGNQSPAPSLTLPRRRST
jgi:hypothetical protein